jgi:hypothetical protein
MEESDGRGMRSDGLGAWMPRPSTAFSGHFGRRLLVERWGVGTRVVHDSDLDDRHLKDHSEYIALCCNAR